MKSFCQWLPGMKICCRLFSLPALALMLVGGLIFLAGSLTLDHTNRMDFCISCHEMKDNNFLEYSHTIHARNRTGVKATCADCHVPHEIGEKLVRKMFAVNDLLGHLKGEIDTKQKFEAHRLEMAKAVWRRMKQTDSRECRFCHDVNAMDPEKQGATARKQHLKLQAGKTCIDCHFGIAHKEPAGGAEPQDALDAK